MLDNFKNVWEQRSGPSGIDQSATCYILKIRKSSGLLLSMTSSHLPPLSSAGVFSVSSSSLIDAPLEKVWSIMLDFSSYKKWQEFNTYVVLSLSISFILGTRLCIRVLSSNKTSLTLLIDAVRLS